MSPQLKSEEEEEEQHMWPAGDRGIVLGTEVPPYSSTEKNTGTATAECHRRRKSVGGVGRVTAHESQMTFLP